ncbi:hypothetical protein DFH11DRAFT_1506604 [Phellopilus nigrolimitatus]|nr:hypothetical protein DFH11DRAFT_1506604 [Phellopilus nigrolimitatus]
MEGRKRPDGCQSRSCVLDSLDSVVLLTARQLALTTVALTVPAALLWRQKRTLGLQSNITIGKKHSTSPPLRRRANAGWGATSAARATSSRPSESLKASSSSPPPRKTSGAGRGRIIGSDTTVVAASSQTSSKTTSTTTSNTPPSLLDGPLISLGAFGLATGLVGFALVLGVWGVRQSMGVDNVDQFAARVRQILRTRMPALSHRLYRSTDDAGGGHDKGLEDKETGEADGSVSGKGAWTWDAAEERLRTAFDRGGLSEWAECAVGELEAERKLERARRAS